MSSYIISDMHYSHQNIIQFAGRPFKDTHHMNVELTSRWNGAVGPSDTVFHLGDFTMGGLKWEHIEPRLTGRKVFIQGNHDNLKKAGSTPLHKWVLLNDPIETEGLSVMLYHYPIWQKERDHAGRVFNHPTTAVEEYLKCDVFLYGHVHDKVPANEPAKAICMCVEQWDYTPAKLTDIIAKWKQKVCR